VLAGIANTEAWDELFLMAKEVNKLKGIDKETAKEAYSKRKAEIETAREPGAEG
jgi:F0F1-type ATP synthase epsilon subunit